MAEMFLHVYYVITSESTFPCSFLHSGVSEEFVLISFFINEHSSTVIKIVLEPLANFWIAHCITSDDSNIFQLM